MVAAVARAHRRDWAQVFATAAQLTRDLDLAEECAQDAYEQALRSWPETGIPERPGAWLITTARNRARDVLRRQSAFGVQGVRSAHGGIRIVECTASTIDGFLLIDG